MAYPYRNTRQHTGDPTAPQRYGIPELRNPRYLATFRAGRKARVLADIGGLAGPDDVPLYSHNATHQSLFKQGWESLSNTDLMLIRHKRATEAAAAKEASKCSH